MHDFCVIVYMRLSSGLRRNPCETRFSKFKTSRGGLWKPHGLSGQCYLWNILAKSMHFVSNKHKPRGCMHTHHAAGLARVFDIRNRVYFVPPVNLSSYRGVCGLKVRLGSSSRVLGAQVIVGSAAMLVARAFGVVCFSLLSNIKSLQSAIAYE